MVVRSAQRGLVLIPVLTSLAIIAAVFTMVDTQQGMRAHSNAKQQDKAVANALAEAGLRDALWRVRKGGSYPNPVTGTLPGHGTYTARIVKNPSTPSQFRISSEGVTANNMQASLIRTYNLTCPNGTTTTTIAKYTAVGAPTNIVENKSNALQNGYLHPRNNPNERTRSLITFDYGTTPPAKATIASATLMLDVQQHDRAMEGARLYVNRVIQSWIDTQADWQNAERKKAWNSPDKTGGHYALADEGSTTIAADVTTYKIDITGIMQAWVDGSSNYGLILRSDGLTTMGPTDFRLKGSSGSTSEHWPRLEVKWC